MQDKLTRSERVLLGALLDMAIAAFMRAGFFLNCLGPHAHRVSRDVQRLERLVRRVSARHVRADDLYKDKEVDQ